MNTVVFLLALPFGDAASLANDDFDTRQRASARLEKMREWALPALFWASKQQDLEQKRRAERLLRPHVEHLAELFIDVLAIWLFYGPVDVRDGEGYPKKFHRCLFVNQEWAENLSDELHLALGARAKRWALLKDYEGVGLSKDGKLHWINIVRHRAHRIPYPK